jgi:hypothetical protein
MFGPDTNRLRALFCGGLAGNQVHSGEPMNPATKSVCG